MRSGAPSGAAVKSLGCTFFIKSPLEIVTLEAPLVMPEARAQQRADEDFLLLIAQAAGLFRCCAGVK